MEVTQGELRRRSRGETGQAAVVLHFAGQQECAPPPPSSSAASLSPLTLVFVAHCGQYIIEPLPVIQNDERAGERTEAQEEGECVMAPCYWKCTFDPRDKPWVVIRGSLVLRKMMRCVQAQVHSGVKLIGDNITPTPHTLWNYILQLCASLYRGTTPSKKQAGHFRLTTYK